MKGLFTERQEKLSPRLHQREAVPTWRPNGTSSSPGTWRELWWQRKGPLVGAVAPWRMQPWPVPWPAGRELVGCRNQHPVSVLHLIFYWSPPWGEPSWEAAAWDPRGYSLLRSASRPSAGQRKAKEGWTGATETSQVHHL